MKTIVTNNLKYPTTAVLKFLIAGGGTGGHIFPAISIANALLMKRENIEILFIGANGKMEMEKVPQAGFNIKGIDIAGFNRSSFLKNIFLPFKILKSFWQVRKIVNEFKPDAAIGVGGYSSFPVLKFCQTKGIKTFIHESNSFAGKANIWLGKKATKIFVASDAMEKFFIKEKIVLTGNPVRKSIVNAQISKSDAVSYFKLNNNKKIILIVGGSLGAKSINETIEQHLNDFKNKNIQLIWQTGKTSANQFTQFNDTENGIWVSAFIDKMEIAYAAADIVISRSGAMSVAELSVVKKPVIFIPFPFAAEDHQTVNAMHLVNKNAALIIKDNKVRDVLFNTVVELLENNEKQNELIFNISEIAILNADEKIAEQILNIVE